MIDDLLSTELPIDRAITRINDHIKSDIDYEHHLDWDQYNIYTWYNDTWGKTPRMYRSPEWDDLEPGDIDDQGHEHPVRFLIVHKDNQGLTSYEKQNALRNLGIDKADTEHYGLVKYTDDWLYSGGGTEDFPLTLTRSAIVDLFMNTAIDARDSIAESLRLAEDAATSSANSSAIAQEAAEKAQIAYGSYARILHVEPYLYDIWYDTLDYKYAYDYYSSADAGYGTGACSAVRNGNFFGRNYDWTYDNNAEFIVHTDAEDGRHAVLGTAASISGLTDEFVRSGQESILYKLVPFLLVDGINDAGLVINMNVVPRQDLDQEHYPDVLLDKNTNKYIYPVGGQQDEKVRISIMMLPRFVLDTFSRVQEAIGWLLENATIYFPDKLLDMGYEIHCLLADKNTTKCIEFINGAINVVDINYITNFHVSGVEFNTIGKPVYTPIDASAETDPKYPTIENNIEKYGSGLERINIINAGYAGANTLQGMKSLMESIYYSRAYSGNNWEEPTELTRWYTEFVEVPIALGSDILTTIDTNIADYAYALSVVNDRFIHRDRAVPGAWLTTHSIVYDISDLKAYIAVQEADKTVVAYHERNISTYAPGIDMEQIPTEGNTDKAVSSDGIYKALGNRSKLTFDSLPDRYSSNVVASSGVNLCIYTWVLSAETQGSREINPPNDGIWRVCIGSYWLNKLKGLTIREIHLKNRDDYGSEAYINLLASYLPEFDSTTSGVHKSENYIALTSHDGRWLVWRFDKGGIPVTGEPLYLKIYTDATSKPFYVKFFELQQQGDDSHVYWGGQPHPYTALVKIFTGHSELRQAGPAVEEVYTKLPASINAGLNISIHDKGVLYQHKPEISSAGFQGELDNNLMVGCGSGGLKASCLLGIGLPSAGGSLYIKNTAIPGADYTEILQLGPLLEGRTIQQLVANLNDNPTFSAVASASVYSDHFIKITHNTAGSVGNNFMYKADTQYWNGEPQPIQFPCFGIGEVRQGSLVPGRDAATNYSVIVNGDSVVLENHVSPQILLVAGTVLKNNRVYTLNRSTGTVVLENWSVLEGATAEIYVDCTTTAHTVNWPDSWIWGDSNIFKESESSQHKPLLALGTITCVVVRKHGNDVIAHVEYIIDKN